MSIKKGPRDVETIADESVLSAAELAEQRKLAGEVFAEEQKQAARDKVFHAEVKRLRRKQSPPDQYVRIVVDAAPYVPFFMLDGEQFYTGYEYEVPRSQAAVLMEQMQRSWMHQDEIEGRSRFASYRRGQDRQIDPSYAGTVTRGLGPGGAISADL